MAPPYYLLSPARFYAARRKFYEAQATEELRAHQALAYYRQLYALGAAAKDFSEEQRLQMGKDLTVPILAQFQQWLQEQRADVLPRVRGGKPSATP